MTKAKHPSQTSNEIQRNKLRKRFVEYNKADQRQKKSPKKVQNIPNYSPVFRVFFASVIMAAIYALIRWGWSEWGWFPKAKDYVPDFAVPIIMAVVHLFIFRNFVSSFKGKAEELAWFVVAILSFSLFMVAGFTGGLMVDRKTVDISDFHIITPEMESALAKVDYLHVKNLSTADLDTIRGKYYFDVSTYHTGYGGLRTNIVFHLYGVYPLRAIPNVYLANETTEEHDYTYASKKVLNAEHQHFIEKEAGFMLKEEMNDRYLKRLLPSDNIEGYQEAIREIYKKENKPFDSDKIIIYEFTNSEKSENGIFLFVVIIFAILLLEIILLLIGYRWFLDKEKYMEAVITSGWWKGLKPDEIIVYSLPVLMTLIFILMLFNGYSRDTTNRAMLMQWGALERTSVLEGHEWWRLLTYGFLHNDFIHLFGNVFIFVLSATLLLSSHNGYRITFVFLLSTFVSGLFFLFWSSGYWGVGASGGVFGILGFWFAYELYVKYVNKERERFLTVWYPLVMIVINLLFSFGNGISMSGHIGGLVAGIILAIIIGIKNKSRHGKDISVKKTWILISILLALVMSLALSYLWGYEKNASVQTELGMAYYNGNIGAEPDYEKAVKHFRKAAELGNVKAQNKLGVCYKYGRGVEQDDVEAAKWYRKAAEQGFAPAQNNLGMCYVKGQGVPQDYDEAIKLYRKAAERENLHAEYNLGRCYEIGIGVEQDYDEAVKWYDKSMEHGYFKAREALERLGKVPPSTIHIKIQADGTWEIL